MSVPNHTNYARSPLHTALSYASSSAASTSSPQRDQYATSLPNASPRMNSQQPPRHMNLPPQANMHPPYYHSHTSTPPAPPMNQMGLEPIPISRASTGSSVGTPALGEAHLNSAAYQHKRAYRQRRKDPSCDACRERKVKCDATEMTSCSECSSRNVKCQFTKETNRRMSSIKQVQDLEKQVSQYKREIAHLRSLVGNREERRNGDVSRPEIMTMPLTLPDVSSQPKRKFAASNSPAEDRIRYNIRKYSNGIFKPPALYRPLRSQDNFNPPRPQLPPRYVSDHLLKSYYESVHCIFPLVHWPTFEQECDAAYRMGGLERIPILWCSFYYAVLAVGVLFSTESFIDRPRQGKEFMEQSRMLTDLWNDDFLVDNARTGLLISIFLTELNLKSSAWTWLGAATRIAQDVGLHKEAGQWPPIEGEMRRRVWWSIYAWDRLLGLEVGRPLLIEDADCDVAFPAAVDDHYIQESGMAIPNSPPQSNMMLPTVHVVRSISCVSKAIKGGTIAISTLDTFDSHFKASLTAIPAQFHPDSKEKVNPRALFPFVSLINARIVLHRHNLAPSCPPDARSRALDACRYAALDTATLLSRVHPMEELAKSAGTLLSSHFWRCTLILLFCGMHEAAKICIRASASIGTNRDVNIACGRNLAFFVDRLVTRRREGWEFGSLNDEELIAYVSGDMQAGMGSAWVWGGSDTGASLQNQQRNSPSSKNEDFMRGALDESEKSDWGGWDRVLSLVGMLATEDLEKERNSHLPPRGQQQEVPVSAGGYQTLPPLRAGLGEPQPQYRMPPPVMQSNERDAKNTRDRISIANII